jgi:uncharacterized protein involved in tolerance to divalent cations
MRRADRVVVLITAGSEEEAHKIARLLVKEKRAAWSTYCRERIRFSAGRAR